MQSNVHSPVNGKPIPSGIYEIQSDATKLFLNSLEDPLYNGWCDDALTLNEQPTRRGKWEITAVGGGYTIKQVNSGAYCALANGEEFLYQSIILSSVPTVWTIEYLEEESNKVRILWSVSDLCWQLIHSNEDHTVVLGNSKPFKELEKPKETMTWILSSLGDQTIPAKVKPGIYSLRNKASGTFVALAPDEKRLGCWSPSHFKNEDTKLWEVKPLGDGYTIRLLGTDKYCTLQNGSINVSTCPAAWKIVRNDSPVHTTDEWFQIYWADSELTWDLDRYGKATPGNTISLVKQDKYQECRLFTFSL